MDPTSSQPKIRSPCDFTTSSLPKPELSAPFSPFSPFSPTPTPLATTTTPTTTSSPQLPLDERLIELAKAYETIIRLVGDDPTRSGVKDTPLRAAKGIMEITKGYEGTIDEIVGDAIFESDSDNNNLVIVTNIEFHSLCEHHLMPFYGTVHIGYTPLNGKILGLSKFARITDLYSQRLQVQEKLGSDISKSIFMSKLKPSGVIVMIQAEHQCMSCRGVKKSGCSTITISTAGHIDQEQRKEFLGLVQQSK
jgi:GTP cyclohydrolase I